MGSIGGADKLIIRGIHQIPDLLDLTGYLIHKLLGGDPLLLCLQLNLLAMLIRARLKEDIIALLPAKTGDAVRQNDLIGISNMRLA